MKVSLFPFLPVLLCVMGAMILLLILIAWDIREQAISPAAATPIITLEEAEELQRKITWQTEEADWFAERFVLVQQEAEEELADLHARLALAERETQKIREELDRLEQLARQLDSQVSVTPEELEHLKRLLAQQQLRRAEAELELAELQQEAARKEKSYAIIPYRGPDGTFRRPIYIECRDNKIIIQPEGVELVPSDFLMLEQPTNPFDTALRVIRQYYLDTGQVVRGSEPYPLLIVRPSGVEMFSTARQATGEWLSDFGYEIVGEDWNIEYPAPNEELRRRLLLQLEDSRNRLSSHMVARRMAEQASGNGNAQQFRLTHRGEVVPLGGPMRNREAAQRHLESNRQPADIRQQQPTDQWASGLEPPNATEMNTTPPFSEQAARETTPEQQTARQMQSLPPQRSQNWALREATQFTSGVSRTVRVRCEADRFVLPTQAGLAMEREIPIADSVHAAVDQLVQTVWEFQNTWGTAGENMHWRPILQVRVSPGGEQRLRELQFLLRDSGLIIEAN